MLKRAVQAAAMVLAAVTISVPASAQDDAQKGIEHYRKLMTQDPFANPGLLFVDRGEDLWKKKRGPKNASLEGCDLGLGPGVVKGAFAQLPRYFKDADKVMSLEGRILWCMEKLQGLDPKEVASKAFSRGIGTQGSEMEWLSSYVGHESNGMKFDVKIEHPKEKEALAVGTALFFMRAGPHDFSCATCHAVKGTRIRLQDLPDLTDPKDTQAATGTWPAYRVSNEVVRSMEHRLADCYRQMRMPRVGYGSDVTAALNLYLVNLAKGGEIAVPALKR